MSRSDVYLDDMKRGVISDRDIDALFSGGPVSASRLADLSGLVQVLHSQVSEVSPKVVERQVAAAAELVRIDVAAGAAPNAAEAARGNRSVLLGNLKRPVVMAGAAAAVLLLATTGVAWAAHGSGPGDALHGIDLALERVGIGSGGAAERLAEAAVLVSNGSGTEGLGHAAAALASENAQNEEAGLAASAALAEAASKVSREAPEGVAELLDQLSEALAGDGVDGETVSHYAQMIRDTVVSLDTPPGPPDSLPVGPPETPVGPPASLPANDSAPVDLPQGPQGPPPGLPPDRP